MMVKNKEYKILTPSGFKKFYGITKLKKSEYLKIFLSNGKNIECSLTHKFISNKKEIYAKDLHVFDTIDGLNSLDISILDIMYFNNDIELYDIIEVDDNNLFIVDDVISHNCDADFISSGNTVIPPEYIQYYAETYVQDPLEKRGMEGAYWIWQYPDYSKNYIVSADVARGDGKDYSALQVMDVDTLEQVAEYRGKIGTKEFGDFCVTVATEYNNALLVIENANVGWASIQEAIDRNYQNLFYSSKDLNLVDTSVSLNKRMDLKEKSQLVAGFTTTMRTRPLIISKLDTYFREKSIIIRSKRLTDELFTFIWNGSKAEALSSYNDDLVMSYAIGLWVRDTAIRLRQEGIELQKATLSNISRVQPIITPANIGKKTGWDIDIAGKKEDLTWLL